MKKIIAGVFISLDGVVEAPETWHFPYFNDEMGEAVGATFNDADTMLFGRTTYDGFAGAWPEREAAGGEDAVFAKILGDMRKIVVSHQQLEFSWRNSEQLQGDFVEAVTALKNEPGDSAISPERLRVDRRQFLAAGLLDELHLLVHPIAVGRGCACSTRRDARSPSSSSPPRPSRPASSTSSTAPPRRRRRHLRRRQGPPAPARLGRDDPSAVGGARHASDPETLDAEHVPGVRLSGQGRIVEALGRW